MDPQSALLLRQLYTDEEQYREAGDDLEADQIVALRGRLISALVGENIAPRETLQQCKDHPWVRRRAARQFAPRRRGRDASTSSQMVPFNHKTDDRQLVTLRRQPTALTETEWNQGISEAQRAKFIFTMLATFFALTAFVAGFFPLLLGSVFFGLGVLCAHYDIRGYHRRLGGSAVKTLAPLEAIRRDASHRAELTPTARESIGYIQYAVLTDYEGGEDVRVALLRYQPDTFAIEDTQPTASAYRVEIVEERYFAGDALVEAASYRAELEHQAHREEMVELTWQQQLADDIALTQGEIQGEIQQQQERQEAARQLARALDASERRLLK